MSIYLTPIKKKIEFPIFRETLCCDVSQKGELRDNNPFNEVRSQWSRRNTTHSIFTILLLITLFTINNNGIVNKEDENN